VQFLALQMKEAHSPEEARAIARFYFCQFYCIAHADLTIEQVLEDRNGRQRGELLNLEAQRFESIAVDRSVKALEKQMSWNQGLCPWDISGAALRRELRQRLELDQYFDVDKEWVAEDLGAIASKARENAVHIKKILNFSIPKGFHENGKPLMSDVQIVHQLLSQMGIKVDFRWQGSGENKHRVYRLDAERWNMLSAVLDRRRLEREHARQNEEEIRSPLDQNKEFSQTGDLVEDDRAIAQWLTPEVLLDVRSMWDAAAGDVEKQAALREFIPEGVLERAIV
jgi:hypothetical protein